MNKHFKSHHRLQINPILTTTKNSIMERYYIESYAASHTTVSKSQPCHRHTQATNYVQHDFFFNISSCITTWLNIFKQPK